MLFCVVTSTVCYAKIYSRLRNQQAQVQDNVHQRQVNGEGISLNIERYKKTVSSALWIQITLVLCYLPYHYRSDNIYHRGNAHAVTCLFFGHNPIYCFV